MQLRPPVGPDTGKYLGAAVSADTLQTIHASKCMHMPSTACPIFSQYTSAHTVKAVCR